MFCNLLIDNDLSRGTFRLKFTYLFVKTKMNPAVIETSKAKAKRITKFSPKKCQKAKKQFCKMIVPDISKDKQGIFNKFYVGK